MDFKICFGGRTTGPGVGLDAPPEPLSTHQHDSRTRPTWALPHGPASPPACLLPAPRHTKLVPPPGKRERGRQLGCWPLGAHLVSLPASQAPATFQLGKWKPTEVTRPIQGVKEQGWNLISSLQSLHRAASFYLFIFWLKTIYF